MGKNLMSLWDTDKPIMTTLLDAADNNKGKLSDSDFNSILREYELEEDDEQKIMDQMMDHETYDFIRISDGWDVSPKE